MVKPDVTAADYKAWERCNDLVCSWLLNNLDDSIAQSVLYFKIAKDIWDDLEDRFGSTSMTQAFTLEQQLSELTQGSKSVSDYFTAIRSLWDALNDVDPNPYCICNKCTCNVNQRLHQKQQDRRLLQFMMKLHEKFASIRGNILMQHPPPTLSNAFRTFAQEERHQALSQITSQTETLAFVADSTTQKRPVNSKPNPGSANSNNKKGNYFYTHCKISGHSVERCFKIHGYTPNFKFKDKKVTVAATLNQSVSNTDHSTDSSPPISMAQYQQLMALLNKPNSTTAAETQDHAMLAGKLCLLANNPSQNGWLIDSGATDHICSDLSVFLTYKPVTTPNEFILIPDGRQVPIAHTGSVKITNDLILHNVLHVPAFHYNLLSVQRLCKDLHCSLVFNDTNCIIQDHLQKGKQILLGRTQGSLYSTADLFNSVPVKSSLLSIKEDLSVWHLRLAHVPFPRLTKIPELANVQNSSHSFICQICPMSRKTRALFTHSSIKSVSPFQLIHIDVWGPYQVKSHTGCNQFLTIVDDFSRFTWIHLLKHRSDCVQVMTDFFEYVET